MKLYYESLNYYHIVIFPLYAFFAYLLLITISRRLLLKDSFLNLYYGALVLLYSSLLLIDVVIDFIPFFPDTNLYTSIIEGMRVDTGQIPFEIKSFQFFSRIFPWISMGNSVLYLVFNLLINQIAIMIYWKSWVQFKKNNVSFLEQRVYLILSLIYPLSIVYSLVPLRESYFIFGFSLFLYGMVRKRLSPMLIIGLVFILLFRKEVFVLSMFLVFLKFTFVNDNEISKRTILSSIFFAPIVVSIGNFLSSKFLNIGINPTDLARFRNYQRWVYYDSGMTYPLVSWDNWISMIIDIPGLLLQFVYAPLPIIVKIDYFSSITYLVDGLFMVVITLVIFLNRRWNNHNQMWWMIILVFIMFSSLFEYYLLGAIRHRYFVTIMLFPLFAEGIIKRSKRNEYRDTNVNYEQIYN